MSKLKPFFLQYKSITISWFILFSIVLIGLSSLIISSLAKEYEEDREKIDDIFFILLITSFIGARLFYVLTHLSLYKDNILLVFTLSHYNLSLTGGVIVGLLTLLVLSKKYTINFHKLLKIFVIPFYFAMAIGIWVVIFDKFLLPFSISNNPLKILSISIIFLLGLIFESLFVEKIKSKYTTLIGLFIVLGFFLLVS